MEEITLNNNLAPGSGLNVISGAKPEEIRSYQCKYCELIMESIEVFRQHICNFYKINGVIYIDTYERDVRELETMLNEHPVHKLFETNKMRAAMLLRDYRTENITGKQRELSKKGGDSYKCSICDRSFVHSSGLLRHLARHDIEDFPHNRTTDTAIVCLICKYCSRVFSDPNDLFRHFMTHFINESVASVATGRMVAGPLINTHYEIANVKHLFGCEFCDFFFKERDFLRKHFYAEHSCNRYYSCTNCNITSKTQRDYQIHKLIECTTAEMFAGVAIYYVCIVCDEGFSSLNQLYEHRTDSKHFGMDYDTQNLSTTMSCEICDFVTTSSDNFIVHRLEHSKDQLKKNTNRVPMPSTKSRQHLCDVCGKTYTQSSHLLQHLRFHQGVRPFACKEVGCTRKFTIRPDLNDHIRKCHTRERPYHCMVCDKRFLTGSVFYQHRLIHRGERRYACEECEKRFYRADALKNHKRIHTGEKPYKCDFCVKNFRQRGDRDKHIRARHGQQNQLQNRNLQADTVQQSEEPSPTSEVDAAAVKFDQADMYSSSMPNINDCDSDEPTDIKLEFPNNMLSSLISDIDCNLQLFN